MKHKKIILLLIVGLALLSISAVAGAQDNSTEINVLDENDDVQTADDTTLTEDQRTFKATGDTIGYTVESYYPVKYAQKAKNQLKQIKNTNKNKPTKYSITISEDQYNQLLKAKKQGKIKEIQIKTNKYINIKKPVFKKITKTIFTKKYSSMTKFKKALKKFKNKYYLDDTYKIKAKNKKITILKKYNQIKYFKTQKARVTASICVNDMQSSRTGKPIDVVHFFVSKLGIDGIIATARISIK